MSGFVGLVHTGASVDAALLKRLTNALSFRGPDAQATWTDGPVGFGHTLLRITTDQAHETQPVSLDDTVWITGDIRLDDRDTLIGKLHGAPVTTDTPDVELVLHSYHAWGDAFLYHLLGDFTFALWDGHRRRLLCARDQLGIAPLYYAQVGPVFVCSNTLNTIRQYPGISDELNEQALADFILFRGNRDWHTTTFSAIKRLPPAHCLILEEGAFQIRQYWSLEQPTGYLRYRRPQDYADHFLDLFQQAVSDRMRTRTVATHLSGGMDSTSVTATANVLLKASGEPFQHQAYTMIFERLIKDDEGHYATLVADTLDISRQILVVDDFLSRPPPASATPEPSLINSHHGDILLHAQAQHRVVLSGFGGDPLLTGDSQYWLRLLRRGRIDHVLIDMMRWIRTHRRRPPYWRTLLPHRPSTPSTPPAPPLPDWLRPEWVERLGLRERQEAAWLEQMEGDNRRGMAEDPFWSNLWSWADPGFTGIPVKMYHPFFDVRLLRFVMTVPPVPWLRNKNLLREAMQGLLPDPVRHRRKTPLAGNPNEARLQQEGVPAWMMSLTAAAELAPYVRPEILGNALQHSTDLSSVYLFRNLYNTLALSHWLHHQNCSVNSVAE